MSLTPLSEDLDIIQNLVIPSMEEDLDIIQKLDDEPNDVGGLSASELKFEFDRAGNIIKSYINNTLVPNLSDTVAEAEERAKAEAKRIANEEGRTAAESARVEAELARVAAEQARAAAESTRASSEEARGNQEAARQAAETARAEAESQREAAEASRTAAEAARENAETERALAETARESAEAGRTSAESDRARAEAERVAAEQARVDVNTGIVAQATEQAEAAQAARSAAAESAAAASQSRADAESSKAAAAGSASSAAASASEAAETEGRLPGYISEAEAAKTAAEAAQAAAEQARDEAQEIVGGDFATKTEAQAMADEAKSAANDYTDQKVAELVDSSPEALNTLNELATALGNDENFSTTVTNKIAEAKSAAQTAQSTANGKAASDLSNVENTAFAQKAEEAGVGGGKIYEATIGTSWTEDTNTGVKSQTVSITGVTAANAASADVRYTGDGTSEGYETFVEQQNQFLELITNGYAETVEGGIKFSIFGDANTISIPIVGEVI